MVEVSSTTRTRSALDLGTLDTALQAVRLGRLADDEGVEPAPVRGGGVQHRPGDRVGAHGQPADRVEVQAGGEVEEDLPDERGGLAVQRDPAQVHVVVGLKTRGEGHLAVHHGLVLDLLQQRAAYVTHARQLRAAASSRSWWLRGVRWV
ncbi:hypothetical protein [Streptomyces sp. LN245]|uniref:hypothetical protein n=1 Tax=Streptomyces sp. LN245 TaxID=3112975 RepID=UPI0037185C13